MVLPLWSALWLATTPVEVPAPPGEPVPSLGEIFANLFESWSFGPSVAVGASLGGDGVRPSFSAGFVSDVFEPDDRRWPRAIDSHLGLSLGARAGKGWEVEVRGSAAGRPLALGPVTLGVGSAVVGSFDGPFAVSLRAGPELAAHFRLGRTLHVLQPFLRYEWALWSRDRFDDRGTVGLLFLWGQ